MKILYLGSSTSYVTQNEIIAFKAMNHDVLFSSPYVTPKNPTGGIVKLEKAVYLPEKDYLRTLLASSGGVATPFLFKLLRSQKRKMKQLFQTYQPDLIYATWGSNMVPMIKTIQDMRIGIPIVYNFLSYPQNVYLWKVILENRYCQRAVENLDGRIHATVHMHNYFKKNFNLKKNGQDIVITPFFSKKYFYKKRLSLLSERDGEPHLVFIGPSHLPWDNIRHEIYAITKEKIHFHMIQPDFLFKANSYLHFFPYFPLEQLIDGSLATFLTQFDACITIFNFRVCSCMDRFKTSYPSRFLFALNAGIPIVMPKGYLLACEEFVNNSQIGFTYENVKQLRKLLSDQNSMLIFRRNAIKNIQNHSNESNFKKINNFLCSVT